MQRWRRAWRSLRSSWLQQLTTISRRKKAASKIVAIGSVIGLAYGVANGSPENNEMAKENWRKLRLVALGKQWRRNISIRK
jgi:hypothetical protein